MSTERALALARKAAEVLAGRGIENARLEAELLMAAVLGITRLQVYTQFDRPLTAEELEAFRGAVRRRLRREPLQYIVGRVQFREVELAVDRRVLIPRPETEELVGAVLEWAAASGGEGRLRALDIGTGSGAIAISLAKEGPFERVVATDVSADALEVARANAGRAGVAERLELRHGALWEPVARGERFDVVVSNPPYVAESERASLAPEVAEWEPAAALFAPGGGLAVIEGIIAGAPERLRPGGLLALEVGASQGAAALERVAAAGAFAGGRVSRDLAGRERMVLATLAAQETDEVDDG